MSAFLVGVHEYPRRVKFHRPFITWNMQIIAFEFYIIYRNIDFAKSESWDGSAISISIDGMDVWTRFYTIIVYDQNHNTAGDTVIATVEPSPNFTMTTTTSQPPDGRA